MSYIVDLQFKSLHLNHTLHCDRLKLIYPFYSFKFQLIVDGYNVIYKWPRLKKHVLNGNLSRARNMLISDLEELKVVKGWRIEVVFDGRFRSTKGVSQVTKYKLFGFHTHF